MEYKKGDRVLYNRQKFGTVWSNQFNPREVDVVFDREKNMIVATRIDSLELVSDAQHEAVLAVQINTAVGPEPGTAGELITLAGELDAGADWETNNFKLRTTMKDVASRLRGIAGERKEES